MSHVCCMLTFILKSLVILRLARCTAAARCAWQYDGSSPVKSPRRVLFLNPHAALRTACARCRRCSRGCLICSNYAVLYPLTIQILPASSLSDRDVRNFGPASRRPHIPRIFGGKSRWRGFFSRLCVAPGGRPRGQPAQSQAAVVKYPYC